MIELYYTLTFYKGFLPFIYIGLLVSYAPRVNHYMCFLTLPIHIILYALCPAVTILADKSRVEETNEHTQNFEKVWKQQEQ